MSDIPDMTPSQRVTGWTKALAEVDAELASARAEYDLRWERLRRMTTALDDQRSMVRGYEALRASARAKLAAALSDAGVVPTTPTPPADMVPAAALAEAVGDHD